MSNRERKTHSHNAKKNGIGKNLPTGNERIWQLGHSQVPTFECFDSLLMHTVTHTHTHTPTHTSALPPWRPFIPRTLCSTSSSGPIIIILVFDRVKSCFVLLFYETVYIEVVQFNPTCRNWVLQKKNLFGASFPLRDFQTRNCRKTPKNKKIHDILKITSATDLGFFFWHGWVA